MVWTLRKKIFIGYGLVLALVVVVLGWAFLNLSQLGRASEAILKENYQSILAAENMVDAIERQDSAVLLLITGEEEEGLKQYRENETLFLEWLGRAKDNVTIEGEEDIIKTVEKGYKFYLVGFSETRLLYHTDTSKAADYYHKTLLPIFKTVRESLIRLREINQETMFGASDRAQSIAKKAILSMVVIGLLALALGTGFSLVLSRYLVRPIRHIAGATKKIAAGDYEIQVPTSSSDELGSLAAEFNVMARKLKGYHDLNIGRIFAEKRKSEAIIENIDDGIVMVDEEFRVVSINAMAAEALGVNPDSAQGTHFLEVMKNEELFQYIKESADSGKSPLIEEGKNIITVGRDEARRHYMFSITPVHTKGGSMVGVLLVLHDVTKLKELDRMKDEFVMTASHELRTPLTSIGMSIDLLLEQATAKLSEDEQRLLSVAHEDLQRLKSLVNDLLDLSKIEAGKMEMDFDRVQVGTICEKAVAVLETQVEDKEIALALEVPEGLPFIRADANKITWVITNLISNALRYTDKGGHIWLKAEQVGPHVHVSVRDDGAGIPYEYQTRIFDKFVQVKTDKVEGGSGLGLALCKEIVRAHGGTIWVDSTPGKGSTFTFTVPIAT